MWKCKIMCLGIATITRRIIKRSGISASTIWRIRVSGSVCRAIICIISASIAISIVSTYAIITIVTTTSISQIIIIITSDPITSVTSISSRSISSYPIIPVTSISTISTISVSGIISCVTVIPIAATNSFFSLFLIYFVLSYENHFGKRYDFTYRIIKFMQLLNNQNTDKKYNNRISPNITATKKPSS